MISEIIYKLNAFDSNFVALSEIITAENAKKEPTIGELQKKYGEFLSIALEQLKLRDKVKKKLPAWVDAQCLFEQRAFEQCTSQTVALWKAHYFKTSHLLSLTGGFGVDDWAWLSTGATVISTDPNKELNHLVRCNIQRLYDTLISNSQPLNLGSGSSLPDSNEIEFNKFSSKATFTRFDLTAEGLLNRLRDSSSFTTPNGAELVTSNPNLPNGPIPNNPESQTSIPTSSSTPNNPIIHPQKTKEFIVYIDPDRRKGDDRLGGKAKEFTPNFIEIILENFTLFKKWLVKLSPMTDIHFLQKELPYPIRFYAIFYQGEVKELLLELGEDITNTQYKSIYIQNEDFETWDLDSIEALFKNSQTVHLRNVELNSSIELHDETSSLYLFETHGSLNCLGLNKELERFLVPLNQGRTFFQSLKPLPKSLGRTFKIQHVLKGSLKQLKQELAKLQISKSSITARECRGLNSAEIQQRLGIKEGGTHTLFVTQFQGEFICWVCTALSF